MLAERTIAHMRRSPNFIKCQTPERSKIAQFLGRLCLMGDIYTRFFTFLTQGKCSLCYHYGIAVWLEIRHLKQFWLKEIKVLTSIRIMVLHTGVLVIHGTCNIHFNSNQTYFNEKQTSKQNSKLSFHYLKIQIKQIILN
jgi:hypothetical protein